jgi:hypothetical protein
MTERNWTAQVVIASDHAGLRPKFKALEDEILHVLARLDEPRQARKYLIAMRLASSEWFRLWALVESRR